MRGGTREPWDPSPLCRPGVTHTSPQWPGDTGHRGRQCSREPSCAGHTEVHTYLGFLSSGWLLPKDSCVRGTEDSEVATRAAGPKAWPGWSLSRQGLYHGGFSVGLFCSSGRDRFRDASKCFKSPCNMVCISHGFGQQQ